MELHHVGESIDRKQYVNFLVNKIILWSKIYFGAKRQFSTQFYLLLVGLLLHRWSMPFMFLRKMKLVKSCFGHLNKLLLQWRLIQPEYQTHVPLNDTNLIFYLSIISSHPRWYSARTVLLFRINSQVMIIFSYIDSKWMISFQR
jgi:hypothetical protein